MEEKHEQTQSKWIIISLVVVIVLVVSTVAVLKIKNTQTTVTPTAIPNTGWKTYTNTKHNFSVQYPSDWSFREFPDSQDGADFKNGSISISAGQKVGNYDENFADYVKVAASKEIQDYGELASLKRVTTRDGVVGYETTWMVQPFLGRSSGSSESLPITYFELPNSKALLVRIVLNRDGDLATYEKMLNTIKFSVLKNVTPTPTVDEEALLETVVKKYIALKHNSDEGVLNVTVSKIEGNYAQGGVSDGGGGGIWFAAKEDGVWKLVWDGNGVILCSDLTLYPDFPSSMIPECWNDASQDIVAR